MEASSTISTSATGQSLSASKKALLEKRLRGGFKGSGKKPAITPRAESGPAPLSFIQQQLWFINQLEPDNIAYNVPSALRLSGRLNVDALHESLNQIVARHDILRTTFPAPAGEPSQVVSPAEPVALPIEDLEALPVEQRQDRAQNLIIQETSRPFALASGPLYRFTLIRLAAEEHILVVLMHHIISDGWSTSLLFRELELLYKASVQGQSAVLPALAIQYADYATWQQQVLQGETLDSELKFWKQKLAGAPGSVALPLDHTAPPKVRFRGGTQSLLLPKTFQAKLVSFCNEHQTTPFMAMLSALYVLLYRWTRQSDLVLGTVLAGRTRRETENLIGCFMNFLPLRAKLNFEQSGVDLLNQVKAMFWEASSHQECAYEKIVEAINPARKRNQNPLYNVAFLMQNWPRGCWSHESLQASELPVKTDTALLDLRWVGEETPNGLLITCEYDLELFEGETIRALVESFRLTLDKLVSAPQTPIGQFPVSTELQAQAERVRGEAKAESVAIAATFTAEPLEESLRYWVKELELPVRIEFAPYNQVFQQLLDPASLLRNNRRGLNVLLLRPEDWVRAASPQNPADASKTSEALGRHANEFLRALKTALPQTATPFLVCICPGTSGNAGSDAAKTQYKHLEARLVQNLKELGVHVIAPDDLLALYPVADYADTQADRLGHIPYTPVFFTALGTMLIRQFHALKRPPRKVIAIDCDQTLWGGVCGEDGPSGIVIDAPRQELQKFLITQYEAGMLLCICSKNNEEDVWAVFDQRPDMLLKREHLAGARIDWRPKSENLRSLSEELRLGLDSFIFIDDNPIECAEVESVCSQVVGVQLPEELDRLPSFLRHCWVFDHPNLTAEDRNRNLLYQQNRAREQMQAQAVNFADFIAGLDLKIVVEQAQPEQLPRLAQLTQRTNQFNCTTVRRTEPEIKLLWEKPGTEILAVSVSDRFGDYGLVGLMVCEPNAEALNVDTFLLSCRALGKGVEHQMLAHLGKRAQVLGLGRVDLQFRSSAKNKPALRFLESVGASFRTSRPEGWVFHFPSDYAAAVTFQSQAEESIPVPDLLAPAPSAQNSGFALPAHFSRCRWIALHAYDPAAIHAALESKVRPQNRSRHDFIGARNPTEQQLCRIWANLLHQETVGVTEEFFELGGTSLLAVRMFSEIQRVFGKGLPLVTLFQAPTIEQLARLLDDKKAPRPSRSLVPIQPKGTKPPLVLIHGAGGGLLWGYTNLAMKLGPDQPVYAVEPRLNTGADAPHSVEQMATRYVQELRGFQPHGPYYLGGYCFGGYVAYEMARQLVAEGEQIALLALLDAAAPNGSYERIPWWNPGFLLSFARNCWHWYSNFRAWPRAEQRSFLRRKAHVATLKVMRRLHLRNDDPSRLEVEDFIDSSQFPEDEVQLWQAHLKAGGEYVPKPYAGRVTLFRTLVQPLFCSLAPHYGWGPLAAGGSRRENDCGLARKDFPGT